MGEEQGRDWSTLAEENREDRIVCHVDMDCFYAACERLREPELRGEPVVVGMGYESGEDHGAVATASYEARACGVESAQGIEAAMERLPPVERARQDPTLETSEAGYYRPVDMGFYESVSEEVTAVLEEVADTLQVVSIDEAYLDVTDSTDWKHVEGVARHLTERIASDVGVTASVGVAPSMSAAKVASDHDKPNGLVIVRPGEVEAFLEPLSIELLHGIGPVTAGELREAGIETVGDLADADESWVRERYGDRGRDLLKRARGEDDREVSPTGKPKSLSRESAFADATASTAEKRDTVETLAAAVAERARREGALYRTVGVKVVEPPFEVHTRAESLPGPVADPDLLLDIALDLLGEFRDRTVRKLGVRVSNLSFPDGEQADLGDWEGRAGGGGTGVDRNAGGNDAGESDRDGGSQASISDFES
ncbi:MAG: DNA polymerase IV [Halobacteriales archaeon]